VSRSHVRPSAEAKSRAGRPLENEQRSEKAKKRAKKPRQDKGAQYGCARSRCLHIGFCSTSKTATVLSRFASY